MEAIPNNKMSPNEAIMEIQNLMQQIATMGANDSEFNQIREIMEGVLSGELSPDEGVRQVIAIRDGKQDYH